MKKFLTIVLSLTMCVVFSSNTFALNGEQEKVFPTVISSSEIQEFLDKAVPVPIPTSNKNETIRNVQQLKHNGSYVHNKETLETTFLPFEFNSSRNNSGFTTGYFPNGDQNLYSRGIIDNDNKTLIQNTAVGPWCNTVKLLIVGNDNHEYIGSGFMLGPNSVATAGHCLYNEDWNGWAKDIIVIPALNGTYQPYGSASWTTVECGGNWYDYNDNQDDWGIIRIDANLGNYTGWLGLRWQSNSYNGETVMAVGYPWEDDSHMYYSEGTVTLSSDRTLEGNWALSGGQSGGPVEKYYSSSGYTAIGVNRGGDDYTYSDCLRIDEWIFNKFRSYRNLTA